MAIPKLHGTFKIVNPRLRTMRANQALSTKRRQRGSVSVKLLLGMAGSVPGFLAGSTFQFGQLKEYVAREAGLGLEQLSYCDFLANPSMSVTDYASMMAAGLVGAFFTGVLASGLPQLLGQGRE